MVYLFTIHSYITFQQKNFVVFVCLS